jgi:hypothetical protein
MEILLPTFLTYSSKGSSFVAAEIFFRLIENRFVMDLHIASLASS